MTFVSSAAGRHAIDVAFSILEKAKRSEFCPRNGERLQLRLALHSGTVREGYEVGGASNIWGMGITISPHAFPGPRKERSRSDRSWSLRACRRSD